MLRKGNVKFNGKPVSARVSIIDMSFREFSLISEPGAEPLTNTYGKKQDAEIYMHLAPTPSEVSTGDELEIDGVYDAYSNTLHVRDYKVISRSSPRSSSSLR